MAVPGQSGWIAGYRTSVQPVEAVLRAQIIAAGLADPASIAIGAAGPPFDVEIGYAAPLSVADQITLGGVVTGNYGAAPPTQYSPLVQVSDKPVKGRVLVVNYYETDNGDGTFSGLAARDDYVWSGSTVISMTSTIYFSDLSIAAQSTVSYFTTSDGKTVTRKG